METKIEKVEMLQMVAPVLMGTAIELQDSSEETSLINLIADDFKKFSIRVEDMVHPGDAAREAADIVYDGLRLARVSKVEAERGFGLLIAHLFQGLAEGTEKLSRPAPREKVA